MDTVPLCIQTKPNLPEDPLTLRKSTISLLSTVWIQFLCAPNHCQTKPSYPVLLLCEAEESVSSWPSLQTVPCANIALVNHALRRVFRTGTALYVCTSTQSCEMSNILHGANLPNQILPPRKARKSRQI